MRLSRSMCCWHVRLSLSMCCWHVRLSRSMCCWHVRLSRSMCCWHVCAFIQVRSHAGFRLCTLLHSYKSGPVRDFDFARCCIHTSQVPRGISTLHTVALHISTALHTSQVPRGISTLHVGGCHDLELLAVGFGALAVGCTPVHLISGTLGYV